MAIYWGNRYSPGRFLEGELLGRQGIINKWIFNLIAMKRVINRNPHDTELAEEIGKYAPHTDLGDFQSLIEKLFTRSHGVSVWAACTDQLVVENSLSKEAWNEPARIPCRIKGWN